MGNEPGLGLGELEGLHMLTEMTASYFWGTVQWEKKIKQKKIKYTGAGCLR